MLKFIVTRKKVSYDYLYSRDEINKFKLNDYQTNTKNNMLDSLQLIRDGITLFESNNVQTVSNHPKMKHSDTIKSGDFQIKCFIDNKGFNTEIHGIINAYDLSGQAIDVYSKQYDNGQYIGRWLIHSSYYRPTGKDTKGYSGGCFIMSTNDMLKLNRVLIKEGINPDDIIDGYLEEI